MGSQFVCYTRTYDETMTMIMEARNYMAYGEARGRRYPGESTDLRFSCEALRVTSRLTQVLAWLMMQRAVVEGEITQQEALDEKNRLAGQDVCLDCQAAGDSSLPAGLRDLMERSFHLYERVARLEQMALTRLN